MSERAIYQLHCKTKTFIFRIIGPHEHNINNQTSNKVNNAINNNQ